MLIEYNEEARVLSVRHRHRSTDSSETISSIERWYRVGSWPKELVAIIPVNPRVETLAKPNLLPHTP